MLQFFSTTARGGGEKQGKTSEDRDGGGTTEILFNRISFRDACMDGSSSEISKISEFCLVCELFHALSMSVRSVSVCLKAASTFFELSRVLHFIIV